MRKFKFFVSYEKEEKWLNEMARQGYQLISSFWGYEFIRTQPEDAVIKIDYQMFINKYDFQNYITMFEDSGWSHIMGTKDSGVQYFKRNSETATEDIFSDETSKAGRYKRQSLMWISFAVCYLPIFIVLVMNDSINIHAMLNPKLLYLTPGLWERTGASFWSGFLFETPFALCRGFAWVVFPLVIAFYFILAYKANKLSKHHKKT